MEALSAKAERLTQQLRDEKRKNRDRDKKSSPLLSQVFALEQQLHLEKSRATNLAARIAVYEGAGAAGDGESVGEAVEEDLGEGGGESVGESAVESRGGVGHGCLVASEAEENGGGDRVREEKGATLHQALRNALRHEVGEVNSVAGAGAGEGGHSVGGGRGAASWSR